MARKPARVNASGAVPVKQRSISASQPAVPPQIFDSVHHARNQQSEDVATFRQLLDEISANPGAIEKDIQSSYKLISVVTEAGLDPLTQGNPFAEEDDLLSQCLTSLHVIELAIHRTPAVVLHSGIAKDGSSQALCLWLLPKLFQLVESQKNNDLCDAAQRLLTTIKSCLDFVPELWDGAVKVHLFYKSCLNDLVSRLEDLSTVSQPHVPFRVDLPSVESWELVSTEIQQPVALRRISQVKVASIETGLRTALQLFGAAVASKRVDKVQSIAGQYGNSENVTWGIEFLTRACQILIARVRFSGPNADYISSLSCYLPAVIEFVDRVFENRCQAINRHMAAQLLVKVIAFLLSHPALLALEHPVRQQISVIIDTALRLSSKTDCIRREAAETLLAFRAEGAQGRVEVEGDEFGRKSLLERLSPLLENESKSFGHASARIPSSLQQHLVNGTMQSGQQTLAVDVEDTGRVIQSQIRPSKRQRRDSLSHNPDLDVRSRLRDEMCALLGRDGEKELGSLHENAAQSFIDISDEQKRRVLALMSEVPCISHKSSAMGNLEYPVESTACHNCNEQLTAESGWTKKEWSIFYRILTNIIKTPTLQMSKEYRIQAMLALKRLVYHSTNSSTHDLTSALGSWCLQSLRSSIRELRIVSGQTMQMYLLSRTVDHEELLKQNRVAALDFLRSLAELEDPRYIETTILALGQAARVCGDDEMNIILVQLIDYLGHANPLVCSIASVELTDLAEVTNTSMELLMKPYWRTIGPHVIKDLHSRPQKAQQLSDLLDISVNQLLARTQYDTVPLLLLWKKKDILQRVATACGELTSVWSLCMQSQNLTSIIARVLAANSDTAEEYLSELLRYVNRDFQTSDVHSLFKSSPVPVACELLKSAADGDGYRRSSVIEGLHRFTNIVVERRPQQSKGADLKFKITEAFFEDHALGVMSTFSDVIDDIYRPSCTLEKRRCLHGIDEMICLAGDTIGAALPQICACLQSALEASELRDKALSAWITLLATLKSDEELGGLVDRTFSAIAQNWASFTTSMQQKVHDSIATLLRTHGRLIKEKVHTIPSLASIPMMSKFESELSKLKAQMDTAHQFQAFARRCRDESSGVCRQALRELFPFLEKNQQFLHDLAISEQPSPVIAELVRSLLDTCVRLRNDDNEITSLCTQSLGIIGCLDPNRIETIRANPEILVLSNFDQASEALDFITFLLENILVKAFHSVSNPRAQSFLAYVMQELLKFCGFTKEAAHPYRPQGSQADDTYQRWISMPEQVRSTLTPFLSSKYVLATQTSTSLKAQSYPIYSSSVSHGSWLRNFAFDLLQKAKGDNAQMIFSVLGRIVRSNDLSVATFLLPFAVANVVVGGTSQEAKDIGQEFMAVLQAPTADVSHLELETLKLCSQNVFQCLDYLSRWIQQKKKRLATTRQMASRSGKTLSQVEEATEVSQIQEVESVISSIPAEIISRRAVECKSYARALFHWEQFIRQERQKQLEGYRQKDIEPLYQHLQDIYAQIDEPDGIEGIASHLHIVDPGQQVFEHEKAGRWSAAQSWYELQLRENPNDDRIQTSLLSCLKNSGQYDMVLNQARAFAVSKPSTESLSIISEAAWSSERWNDLEFFLSQLRITTSTNFNTVLGSAMLAIRNRDLEKTSEIIATARTSIAKTLSDTSTASLQACHDQLLKLHALYEVELISGSNRVQELDHSSIRGCLDRRLNVLGAFLHEKQYLLGIRRSVMLFSDLETAKNGITSSWMATARIARKENAYQIAYNAVLKAAKLGDDSAKIEHARLLWKEGQHRKAIQSLEGAIASNIFQSANIQAPGESGTETVDKDQTQNLLIARAHLLLAKWLDAAGQTQSHIINDQYRIATNSFPRWEKGQYYLGRYYNKLLESEKVLPTNRQSSAFLSGETAKLVVDNYLRSLSFGTKYIFQTLPKLLTLWLDLGETVNDPISRDVPEEVRNRASESKSKMLDAMTRQIKKYLEKIPSYIFYTALAQMLTRITHPNSKVYNLLESVIIKAVVAYPQQSLWSLFAVVKSSSRDRAGRGLGLLKKLQDRGRNIQYESLKIELRTLISLGSRLTDQLLSACEVKIEGRSANVSLSKDLGFNLRVAQCPLVIPLEKTLTAALPTSAPGEQPTPSLRHHQAFPTNTITISSVLDDVLVLNSLQRPRKITLRGSDGNKYGLLCKPKDDLRKDQRLMEFNAMINRALKKDADASKRRLYIKTYAVTPLNEECGLIEWVDGLKPLRDILLNIYRQKGVKTDFMAVRNLLDEACATPNGYKIFTDRVLPMYTPILHEYFADLYPEPETWLSARLRYTRSGAVASMVGFVLGLGDRHGENVLLEEESGGVFHVDFNCLFEKGLTFDKPELVPFRLTHNMVDACGVYGVEGPWRRSAELAFRCMRGNEDALLTILETFVYDPTADFVGTEAGSRSKAKKRVPGVPETPREVLQNVRGKVNGLLKGESVPLSVEGVVDALIRQATDPANLCAMYIGWCAFL